MATSYEGYAAGLADIVFVKAMSDLPIVVPKMYVGSFGIKGGEYDIKWVITRVDRRHGYIGKQVDFGNYNRSLFNSMFRGWTTNDNRN